MAKKLTSLTPAALRLLKKHLEAACNETREQLGQTAGEFAVDETVCIHLDGTVKVAKSNPNKSTPQCAKPWDLVTALLTELNRERAAASKAGITIEQVVEMAEAVDPDLSKKAKDEADARVAAIKEPHRKFTWGGVTPKGEVEVLAVGNHLAEADDDDESDAA